MLMTGQTKKMTVYTDPRQPPASVASGKLRGLLPLGEEIMPLVATVLHTYGIPLSILRAPDARLPLRAWMAINHRVADKLGDRDFGLHQGERLSGLPTLLGHSIEACPTAREALDTFLRYQSLEQNGWHLDKRFRGEKICIEYRPLVQEANDRILIDCLMSGIVSQYFRLTGVEMPLSGVDFPYPRPSGIEEHKRLFRCEPCFDAAVAALRFPSECLDRVAQKGNEAVRRNLESALRAAFDTRWGEQRLAARVLLSLDSNRTGRLPQLCDVAADLGVEPRRLQLLLSKEGTCFRDLREDACKAMAVEYLGDPALSIEDIGVRLGFSEASAFLRAFRRWMGISPARFRRHHLAAMNGEPPNPEKM